MLNGQCYACNNVLNCVLHGCLCQVASPPPPESLNSDVLFLCKGDIFAGETKQAREPTSVLVSSWLSAPFNGHE